MPGSLQLAGNVPVCVGVARAGSKFVGAFGSSLVQTYTHEHVCMRKPLVKSFACWSGQRGGGASLRFGITYQ